MRIDTDDEIYRVNATWLGPDRCTLPMRWTYVQWGVAVVAFFLILAVLKAVAGFGVFTVLWSLLLAGVVAKIGGRIIDYERPLGSLLSGLYYETRGPRPRTRIIRGAVGSTSIHIRHCRPRPTSFRLQRRCKKGIFHV